ncbi:MAG: hypothetical protein ACYTFG_17580, partial [Planctomycetota bacterium]
SYAFDPVNDLHVNLMILSTGSGNIPPGTIQQMNFAPREDEIVINWTWEYRKATVIDGLFEFRIDISYGVVDHNFTNSSYFELEFPKEKDDSGGVLAGLPGGPMVIGILAVLVIAVVVIFYRRSRAAYPAGYRAPPGPPRKRAKPRKEKKLSKKQRKALMEAEKNMPPPRGPRSPDRTPMPGRGPPGSGAPPPQGPGAPRGAPRPGTARPRR